MSLRFVMSLRPFVFKEHIVCMFFFLKRIIFLIMVGYYWYLCWHTWFKFLHTYSNILMLHLCKNTVVVLTAK